MNSNEITIDSDIMLKWQSIVDIVAELFSVKSALILRLKQPEIEVLIASKNEDNPITAGFSLQFENSGIFCETVIKTNEKLQVPNALNTEKWKNGPAVKMGTISYMGFPIILPNGKPFGTICVEDNIERVL